jgi:hypothetical protein
MLLTKRKEVNFFLNAITASLCELEGKKFYSTGGIKILYLYTCDTACDMHVFLF